MPVHLPGRQIVSFDVPADIGEAMESGGKTMLTEYFTLNQNDLSARQYLYLEIPQHYVFESRMEETLQIVSCAICSICCAYKVCRWKTITYRCLRIAIGNWSTLRTMTLSQSFNAPKTWAPKSHPLTSVSVWRLKKSRRRSEMVTIIV